MNAEETINLESTFNSNKSTVKMRRSTLFNLAVTNARSIIPKINSLVNAFSNLDLSCIAVTETWMNKGVNKEAAIDELKGRHDISSLTKDRRGRGGGVALFYRDSKVRMTEHKFKRKRHEMIAGKVTITESGHSVYNFVIYVKPSMSAVRKEEIKMLLMDAITDILTKERGAYITIWVTLTISPQEILLTCFRPSRRLIHLRRGALPIWI